MSRRQLLMLSVVAVSLVAAMLYWGLRQRPIEAEAQSLIFPELAPRQERIDKIRLLGAGKAVLVTMHKRGGQWRVLERDGWPADAGKISQMLFTLAQARLQEPKTTNPALYSKIGVEPLANPHAQGLELQLDGGGPPLRLLVGHAHVNFDGDYVRINDGARSWLTDRRVDLARDPVEWLDRHLVDLPLARIEKVEVESADGFGYNLVHRDDRFGLADMPSAAMGDSHAGDAMAGFLDQLSFEDVANDDGKATVERTVRFIGVDGVLITIDCWREKGRVWARFNASLDDAHAETWLANTTRDDAQQRTVALKKLHGQVDAWQSRFAGKRFLLPMFKSAILLMGRSQILKGDE